MGRCADFLVAGSLWVLAGVVLAQIQGCGGGEPPTDALTDALTTVACQWPCQWTYETGDAVDSSPAVGDGVVFVGSNDNKLHAVNATTGEPKWTYETGGAVASPAVAGGVVFVVGGGSGGTLHAVSLEQ